MNELLNTTVTYIAATLAPTARQHILDMVDENSRLLSEGARVEDAAFRFLMHIQKQIEQQAGWMQFDYYHPEIDVYEYTRFSEALGSKDHAKSSELLERYSASTRHDCIGCGEPCDSTRPNGNHICDACWCQA